MLIWLLKNSLKVARHSIVLSLLFYASVCLAASIYYLFYNWYLPRALIQRKVNLEIQNSIQRYQRDALSYDMIGVVSLFDDMAETLHYGQEYAISLVIEMPESEINFDTGKLRFI
jgi:hypothetical protein